MTTRFPTGQLKPCSYLLEAIPRPVFIQALITHCQADHHDGKPVRTRHEHDGQGFTVETAADRRSTTIRLED